MVIKIYPSNTHHYKLDYIRAPLQIINCRLDFRLNLINGIYFEKQHRRRKIEEWRKVGCFLNIVAFLYHRHTELESLELKGLEMNDRY